VPQAILGGWQLNGITNVRSGFPLGFTTANNQSGTALTNRPNVVCNPRLDNPTVGKWFDTACFAAPPAGTLGNAGRTIGGLYGPRQVNFDLSIYKMFTIAEGRTLQFRTEVFNIFNHAQFATPNTTFGNPSFGQILSTIKSPRQVQFALKIVF